MTKRIAVFSSILAFFSIVFFTECEKSVNTNDSNCEIVYQGDRYLKVVNETDVKVEVYLGGYGAELNSKTCERYGVFSGTRPVEFTNLSTQMRKTININVAQGETYEIIITSDFFNK